MLSDKRDLLEYQSNVAGVPISCTFEFGVIPDSKIIYVSV
ncbi:hypothetical protein HNR48_000620 [Pseudoteredinibacter isoporae]|uniref:Uncharacterized protein n=1 Tax=Pseudoteredinibacter isoporae TaxID=570281 RepID=A0A7X0JQJ1_9GAMM|nr:hypothetical protein [Pseudoteredinibacter isoporae]